MALKDSLLKNPQVLAMAQQMFNSMGTDAQTNWLKRPTATDFSAEGAGLNTFGDLGSLALGAAKAHPFKTAGLVGLGAGNIGGLTDNNKFGGQLGGLALGGLGAATLASGNPYLQAMMTMGGGELGALFDKLRAKKEQEQAQMQPFGGR